MDYQFCFTDFTTGAPIDLGFSSSSFSPFAFHEEESLDTLHNTPEYENDMLKLRRLSISLSDLPLEPISACSSRKSSIDILSFIPAQQEDTTLDSPSTLSSDIVPCEVPTFQLTPPVCTSATSISPVDYMMLQLKEHRAQECKKRRHLRMSILKRKRQEGSISFDVKVRYKQRSEFAMKRTRSCGRFAPGVQYSNVNI